MDQQITASNVYTTGGGGDVSKAKPPIKPEYYCETCQMQMQDQRNFEFHMSGKFHKRNLELREKGEDIIQRDKKVGGFHWVKKLNGVYVRGESHLEKVVEHEDDTVAIGLTHITEYQRFDGHPRDLRYICSLCDAKHDGVIPMLEHVKSTKHHLAVMKESYPYKYEQLAALYSKVEGQDKWALQTNPAFVARVADAARSVQTEFARGNVNVRILKMGEELPRGLGQWRHKGKPRLPQSPTVSPLLTGVIRPPSSSLMLLQKGTKVPPSSKWAHHPTSSSTPASLASSRLQNLPQLPPPSTLANMPQPKLTSSSSVAKWPQTPASSSASSFTKWQQPPASSSASLENMQQLPGPSTSSSAVWPHQPAMASLWMSWPRLPAQPTSSSANMSQLQTPSTSWSSLANWQQPPASSTMQNMSKLPASTTSPALTKSVGGMVYQTVRGPRVELGWQDFWRKVNGLFVRGESHLEKAVKYEDNSSAVGLTHITEYHKSDGNLSCVRYSCSLCDTKMCGTKQALSHVEGIKHRLAVIKQRYPEAYKDLRQLYSMGESKGRMVFQSSPECMAQVAEAARGIHSEFGRGRVDVQMVKVGEEKWKSKDKPQVPPSTPSSTLHNLSQPPAPSSTTSSPAQWQGGMSGNSGPRRIRTKKKKRVSSVEGFKGW